MSWRTYWLLVGLTIFLLGVAVGIMYATPTLGNVKAFCISPDPRGCR